MSKEKVDKLVTKLYNDGANKRNCEEYLAKAKEKMLNKEIANYFKPNIKASTQSHSRMLKQRIGAISPREDMKHKIIKSAKGSPTKKKVNHHKSPSNIEPRAYEVGKKVEKSKVPRKSRKYANSFVPDYKAQSIIENLYNIKMKT